MNPYDSYRHLFDGRGSRRDFLRRGGGAAGLILLGTLPARRGDATPRIPSYPFTLGVASGDPTPDGVVLWTRLLPLATDEPVPIGIPLERVPVRWEVAADEGFRRIVQSGSTLAIPELGHSVHVEVEGLEPDRVYWYRFQAAGEASPIGRARTAPAPGTRLDSFLFAFASCQHYEAGYYTAHRHLAEEDLRLVVHLGDYIYEGGVGQNRPRAHNGPEIVTLQDYRDRYALYKSDPDLQAAHASAAWLVSWDDHEVDNDYNGDLDQDGSPREAFLRRRADAYQAYYENMPLRRNSMPTGPHLRLYRRLSFGDLAEINVLDTRQYRTGRPCGGGFQVGCAEAFDPDASILGAEQERWLLDGLGRTRSRWNILANQVPVAQIDRAAGPEARYQMDKWDGYIASRDRVTHFMRDRAVPNPVVLTGDVHVNWVADIKADYRDVGSDPIGTEFVGTSISSGGDGSAITPAGEAMLAENPHMKYFNGQRGYVRCTLTPERWVSDYRVVDYVTRPGAPIRDHARFVVENGRPGAQPG